MKTLFKAIVTKTSSSHHRTDSAVSFSKSPKRAVRNARETLYNMGHNDCGSETLQLFKGNKSIYYRIELDSGHVFESNN